MKKIILVAGVVLILVFSVFFLNGGLGIKDNPEEGEEFFIERGDESLYLLDKTLYFKENKSNEEVDSFNETIENIDWSKDGRYFLVDTLDKSYIYKREDLKLIRDFNTNGRSIFSEDSTRLLLGLRDKTNDLAIYNLESSYIEPVLRGENQEVYLALYWEGKEIGYLEEGSKKEGRIELEEKKEDRLMDLVGKDGDLKEIIDLLGSVDREKLYMKYGDESVIEVLNFLASKNIRELDSMKELIGISDSFVGEEHYKYMELLGTMYLSDITNFVKALTSYEDKVKEIAYDLHDLKLYDREGSDLTEDLNSIIMSKELTDQEKKVGMDLISTYADCGA